MKFNITFCTNKNCRKREFCHRAEENHKNMEWLKDKRYTNFNCENKLKERLKNISPETLKELQKQFEKEEDKN